MLRCLREAPFGINNNTAFVQHSIVKSGDADALEICNVYWCEMYCI